jgi:hypothetical protein
MRSVADDSATAQIGARPTAADSTGIRAQRGIAI